MFVSSLKAFPTILYMCFLLTNYPGSTLSSPSPLLFLWCAQFTMNSSVTPSQYFCPFPIIYISLQINFRYLAQQFAIFRYFPHYLCIICKQASITLYPPPHHLWVWNCGGGCSDYEYKKKLFWSVSKVLWIFLSIKLIPVDLDEKSWLLLMNRTSIISQGIPVDLATMTDDIIQMEINRSFSTLSKPSSHKA